MKQLHFFKKIFLLSCCLGVFISCIKEDDFNFNNLTTTNDDIAWGVDIPLVTAHLNIKNFVQDSNSQFDFLDDSLFLSFQIPDTTLQFSDFIEGMKLPSAFSLSPLSINIPQNLPIDTIVLRDSVNEVFQLTKGDAVSSDIVLDSIKVKSMQLNIHYTNTTPFPITFKFSSNNMRRPDGSFYSKEITLASNKSNEQAVLDFDQNMLLFDNTVPSNPRITVYYQLLVHPTASGGSGTISFDAAFASQNELIDICWGDFGQIKFNFEGDETIPLFSFNVDYFNLGATKVDLKILNSIGLPIGIDSCLLHTKIDNNVLRTSNLLDPHTIIPSPTTPFQTKDASISQDVEDVFTITGGRIPNMVGYNFLATTNPGNPTDASSNFITHDSKITIGAKIDIPMAFAIGDLQIIDTMPFSLSFDTTQIEALDYIDLKIKFKNGLPFEIKPKIIILDDSYHVLDSLISWEKDPTQIIKSGQTDSDGNVKTPVTSTVDIRVDHNKALNFVRAKYVLFEGNVSTDGYPGDPKIVRVDWENQLDVRMGAKIMAKPLKLLNK